MPGGSSRRLPSFTIAVTMVPASPRLWCRTRRAVQIGNQIMLDAGHPEVINEFVGEIAPFAGWGDDLNNNDRVRCV